MLNKYFSRSDELRLLDQAVTVFKEVSSGVYYVKKDRMGVYPDYVQEDEVATVLNSPKKEKVAVTGNSGLYANFDLMSR
ncbi:hypothetical protein [Lederbergia lenta]|uniref:hypothetical protein n=1 Tax=Lederbergia lenta TaxID=1467 RepID=UPI00203ED5B5|nr:hypothetical protein [Lederbergia lenta]MCM3109927.1 hypothetical protein [Lederbergia lenta]